MRYLSCRKGNFSYGAVGTFVWVTDTTPASQYDDSGGVIQPRLSSLVTVLEN